MGQTVEYVKQTVDCVRQTVKCVDQTVECVGHRGGAYMCSMAYMCARHLGSQFKARLLPLCLR